MPIAGVVAGNTGDALTAQIATASVGTVIPVLVAVFDSTVVRTDAGQTVLNFTVALNRAPTSPVSLYYLTADRSAKADVDYVPDAGLLTWAAGDATPRTIPIPVLPGSTFSPDKIVQVILFNPSQAAIARASGIGLILNSQPFNYVAPSDGQPNDLVLSADGSDVSLKRNDTLVFDGQLSQSVPFIITGAQDAATSLTVRFVSPSDAFSAGVQFQGQTSGDSLMIEDGVAQSVQHSITGASSGTFIIDGAQISYNAVEWVADLFAPAVTGFPVVALEGTQIPLHGSPTDPTPTYTYDWSVTKDGLPYASGGDADFGFTPNDDGQYVVSLTLSADGRSTATTVRAVTVQIVAPMATLADSEPITYGETATVSFASQLDPSSADTTAGFHYAYATSSDGLAEVTYDSGSSTDQSHDFAGLKAGDQTLYARIIDQDDGFTQYSTVVHVNQKALTGSITADNKVYDGTTAAAITSRWLTGTIGSDDVGLSGGTATFADRNSGTDKTVTATGFILTGAAAGNYCSVSHRL